MAKRNASPLFRQYALENKLCDYITSQSGGNHVVHEVSDLVLGLTGQLNKVIKGRTDFSELYTNYLAQRNTPETKMFTVKDMAISKI